MLSCGRGVLNTSGLISLWAHPVAGSLHLWHIQLANFAKAAAKPAKAIATSNKAGKKVKDPGTGDIKTQKFLVALTPQDTPDLELSPEDRSEAERRSKEYSRRKMQEHRAWQRDLTIKIQLRDAAIAALPTEELRAAAKMPDYVPFPTNRQMWTTTPPIPGYQESQAEALTARFAKSRRR